MLSKQLLGLGCGVATSYGTIATITYLHNVKGKGNNAKELFCFSGCNWYQKLREYMIKSSIHKTLSLYPSILHTITAIFSISFTVDTFITLSKINNSLVYRKGLFYGLRSMIYLSIIHMSLTHYIKNRSIPPIGIEILLNAPIKMKSLVVLQLSSKSNF